MDGSLCRPSYMCKLHIATCWSLWEPTLGSNFRKLCPASQGEISFLRTSKMQYRAFSVVEKVRDGCSEGPNARRSEGLIIRRFYCCFDENISCLDECWK